MSSSVTVKDGVIEIVEGGASETITANVEADPETIEAHPETRLALTPSAALAVDLGRAREFRRHTKAEKTEVAYESSWKRFCAWAATRGLPILPVPSEVVEAYVGWLAAEGYSLATIDSFLSAGTHYHRAAGLDFPRNTPGVRETLKGIRRRIGVRQTKKAPLGLATLSSVCARLENTDESLRNRALLTVGWFCMLRSSSLVAIRREHVRLVRFVQEEPLDDDESPEGLILHLPFTKTDQIGAGRDVAVHAQPDETVCPVRALVSYFAATRFAPGDRIFPISERTVSRLIKRLVANPAHEHKSLRDITQCASCTAVASRFASHSLRRGSATGLARAGVPEREIMRQGGWKSERVARGYIDDALLFENNPTKGLARK